MCYYSVEAGDFRDASVNDVLEVRRQFHHTNWLVDQRKPTVAVCMRTGATARLHVPPEMQQTLCVGPVAVATFHQEDPTGGRERDVFVFANGEKIALRQLPNSLRVEVRSVTPDIEEEQPAKEEAILEEAIAEEEPVLVGVPAPKGTAGPGFLTSFMDRIRRR